ncbi:hypothetical protein GOB94_13125 [Granulicella sp. 5B5]|uniref:hypothetical protein n=1 Tax=Granulicella sp. 5B5 TaxID=1617967 RepID=UPI0015F7014B|nr:hypothetical protein [Granulicella sp. 5B5]QMV19522.1 hypothetical protein GOB94_13125 [Granulicella sp. 5B5]
MSSDVEREVNIESCHTSGTACQRAADVTLAAQREKVLQRLIDQKLIWQQMRAYLDLTKPGQPGDPKPAATTSSVFATQSDQCSGKGGWSTGLQSYGITPQSLHQYCNLQAAELAFVDQRFRVSIHIGQDEITTYYHDRFVPEYRKTSATPPPLDAIEADISTLLMEREVSLLLDDWLRVLRAQSHIVILRPVQVSQ